MDYLLHTDPQSLGKLATAFRLACSSHGHNIGILDSMRILREFVDIAKEQGLIEELTDEKLRELLETQEGMAKKR